MKNPSKQSQQAGKKNQTATAAPQDNIPVQPPVDSPAAPSLISEPLIKKAFFGSLIFMLIFLWVTGFNSGFHCDEIDMNNYAKANIAYYTSGFKDTTYLGKVSDRRPEGYIDPLLRYYGSSFEYIAVGATKLAGLDKGKYEYASRHVVVQLFAVIALLFAGLLARRASGWLAALCTIWIMYLTPMYFGHSIFNSKDLPFCVGYIASLYLIVRFLQEMPAPTWKTTLLLMLSFAFTAGIRIGGVLLVFYLGLFALVYLYFNKDAYKPLVAKAAPIVLKGLVVAVGGMVIVVLMWPYLLTSPIEHLPATFGAVKKWPLNIKLAFEGIYTDSQHIPSHYIPKHISMTLPLIVIAAIVSGIVIAFQNRKQYDWKIIGLILFTSIFPVVYAIMSHVAVYCGWRHFLFIYPGLAIMGGLGLAHILTRLKKPVLRIALLAVCALAMVKPVMFMVKNHPCEYVYYNELAGGFTKAYYEYETEYWAITMKENIDWMMAHEPILQSKDTINIVSNMEAFCTYYIHRNYPTAKVKIAPVGCLTRYGVPWTYGLFNNIFLKPEYLENFFPPCQTIHTENVEGLPVNIVIKDTVRLDQKAQLALGRLEYALADSLLTVYLTRDCPTNVGLLGTFALIKADLNKFDEAITIGNQCLKYDISPFSHYDAHCALGVAYGNARKFDSSINHLRTAMTMFPKLPGAPNILNQVMAYRQKLATMPPDGLPR